MQAKQVADDPDLQPWVTAVGAAKGRTGDNLGTKYPKISQQLWTAVQKAESGSATPAGGAARPRSPRPPRPSASSAAADRREHADDSRHGYQDAVGRATAWTGRRSAAPPPARRQARKARRAGAVGGLGIPRPGGRSTWSPSTPIRSTATST